MKHVKIYEEYVISPEGDIGMETAKYIVSEFIDNNNWGKKKTLQNTFNDIVISDNYDETQRMAIAEGIERITELLGGEIYIQTSDAYINDYNIKKEGERFGL